MWQDFESVQHLKIRRWWFLAKPSFLSTWASVFLAHTSPAVVPVSDTSAHLVHLQGASEFASCLLAR